MDLADPISVERHKIVNASRDSLGFSVEEQANLSDKQVTFILAHATTGDIEEATSISRASDSEVVVWFGDAAFRALHERFMENKREGVKLLGSQMLPSMMLRLQNILEHGGNKEALVAIKLLANMQGLMVEGQKQIDRDALADLIADIRKPRPIISDVTGGNTRGS